MLVSQYPFKKESSNPLYSINVGIDIHNGLARAILEIVGVWRPIAHGFYYRAAGHNKGGKGCRNVEQRYKDNKLEREQREIEKYKIEAQKEITRKILELESTHHTTSVVPKIRF